MELELTASNRKAVGHMVDAVTNSPCSFDVSSSSPTTVSGRIVEDPGNLNSRKRAIKLIYHTAKKYRIAVSKSKIFGIVFKAFHNHNWI